MATMPTRFLRQIFAAVGFVGLTILPAMVLRAADAKAPGRAPDPAMVKQLLRVLPDDSEGVIVAGPNRYAPPVMPKPIGTRNGQPLYAPNAVPRNFGLESEAFRCNTIFFDLHPQLQPLYRSLEVALTLAAFCPNRTEFEIPGKTSLDCIQVIATPVDVPDSVQKLFRSSVNRLAGFPMLQFAPQPMPAGIGGPVIQPAPVFDPAVRGKPRYFYALPTNRILVAATSKQSLEEVLKKFVAPAAEESGFKLPGPPPGNNVTVWAIRHLGRSYSLKDHPDAKAFVVEYDSAKFALNIRLLPNGPESKQALSTAIREVLGDLLTLQRSEQDASVSIANSDGRTWAVVYPLLGLVVYR